MDASRRRRPSRAVIVACALSLGVHLAILPFLRIPAPARANVPEPRLHFYPAIVRHTPVPRPTPPPAPLVHHPATSHAPRTIVRAPLPRHGAVIPPHASTQVARAGDRASSYGTLQTGEGPSAGAGSPGPAVPAAETAAPYAPEPTPVPTAAATESPACGKAPRDATVLVAVTPDAPAIASAEGATGHVEVRVDLTAAGAVARAGVYRSSGNPVLDRSAVDAAEHATYAPASDGCKPIAGSYVYTVDFTE